jgi:hypothetical protein
LEFGGANEPEPLASGMKIARELGMPSGMLLSSLTLLHQAQSGLDKEQQAALGAELKMLLEKRRGSTLRELFSCAAAWAEERPLSERLVAFFLLSSLSAQQVRTSAGREERAHLARELDRSCWTERPKDWDNYLETTTSGPCRTICTEDVLFAFLAAAVAADCVDWQAMEAWPL